MLITVIISGQISTEPANVYRNYRGGICFTEVAEATLIVNILFSIVLYGCL